MTSSWGGRGAGPGAVVLASVVIPTCDRREVLARCLRALAGQTCQKFETLVVDDASSDGTQAMLTEAGGRWPSLRLRVLRNQRNLGPNPSRARAVEEARGEIVAFLDSDSIAEPDWLERLLAAFDRPEVAAVTGQVIDPEPRNLWELALRGTYRVSAQRPVSRLIGCNMAVRRQVLLAHALDGDCDVRDGRITAAGRCDEEGLMVRLQAAGLEVVTCPEASVYHEHFHDCRSFFLHAHKGGRAAARLVYKYRLGHRLDLLPFLLAYGSLPVALLGPLLLPLPPLFLLGGCAAIVYNELARKGKTPGQTLVSLPALWAYYHVRLHGYVRETLALHLGRQAPERVRLGVSRPPMASR